MRYVSRGRRGVSMSAFWCSAAHAISPVSRQRPVESGNLLSTGAPAQLSGLAQIRLDDLTPESETNAFFGSALPKIVSSLAVLCSPARELSLAAC